MPKIMQINCACTGSTGKIIGDIADYIATKGYETSLCAPCAPGNNPNIKYYRTSLPYEQGIYRRLNRFYGYQYGFAPLSTMRILRRIKTEKPDLLHIHCVNGFMVNVYSLFRFIKKHKIPVVITNHAEFFYTGNCPLSYECEKWKSGCGQCQRVCEATGGARRDTTAKAWEKMREAFSGMKNVIMVSVSPWVGERASCAPMLQGIPQQVVKNGVNTQVFTYRDTKLLRGKYGLSKQTKVIFHPTASFTASDNDRKGGRYVLELAKQFQGQDVLFVVAGRHSKDLQCPDNVKLLGVVSDQRMLAEYYALADVTVVAGKQETFNMPVAESLCCGTPVVGFLAGGPESIALKHYSCFSEQGNLELLATNLQDMLLEQRDKQAISELAKKQYAAEIMSENYLSIYNHLLKDGSS